MRQACALVCAALLLAGCTGKPSAANIELRKRVQELEAQVARLQLEREADRATIRALESRATTIPTLPKEQLDSLFTVHGLKLGRLTGGADLDPSKPGEDGLKIYLTPTDADGDNLKSAGAITVEAFDLAATDTRAGTWSFSAEEARKLWNGSGLLYEYILPCPWQTAPAHDQITVKVTFVDALTARSYSVQKIITIKRS